MNYDEDVYICILDFAGVIRGYDVNGFRYTLYGGYSADYNVSNGRLTFGGLLHAIPAKHFDVCPTEDETWNYVMNCIESDFFTLRDFQYFTYTSNPDLFD